MSLLCCAAIKFWATIMALPLFRSIVYFTAAVQGILITLIAVVKGIICIVCIICYLLLPAFYGQRLVAYKRPFSHALCSLVFYYANSTPCLLLGTWRTMSVELP